jgi:hypothetical protein
MSFASDRANTTRRSEIRPRIGQVMRQAVAARDGLVQGATAPTECAYCFTPLQWRWLDKRVRLVDASGMHHELDHVDPIAWGGPNVADNVVPACCTCNRIKGAGGLPPEIRLRVLSKALGDSSSDLLSESPALIDQQIAWRLVERIERAEAARRLAKGDEANA